MIDLARVSLQRLREQAVAISDKFQAAAITAHCLCVEDDDDDNRAEFLRLSALPPFFNFDRSFDDMIISGSRRYFVATSHVRRFDDDGENASAFQLISSHEEMSYAELLAAGEPLMSELSEIESSCGTVLASLHDYEWVGECWGRPFNPHRMLWRMQIFDLAWSGIPGSPLRVDSRHESTGHRSGIIPNMSAACVVVIDWLLSSLDSGSSPKTIEPKKPRISHRDQEFLRLQDKGESCAEIARIWNLEHDDNVGEEAVRKAISRARRALSQNN